MPVPQWFRSSAILRALVRCLALLVFPLCSQEKTRVQTRQTPCVSDSPWHKKSGVSAALRVIRDMERAHTSFYIFILYEYR